ncbi:nucleolar protein 6 [Spodoptera frugiperda]|uniref:Nucleolar protein 6 n=1 Tax=Spodoptera frugiperda TaxID=7108 RepID=A0A9R0EEG6_SPOFR|nr:nucleolar protein 6 [Spodoptera frugiperda]
MVKRNAKTSVSEEEGEAPVVNENGKRAGEDQNKDGAKRIRTKSLYRQPTVNELNRLQETENLFNSNLFRLQIDEIIQEVKVKEKTEKKFLQFFNELKTYLLSISEDGTEYDLSEQAICKKLKVKLPISERLSKTKCMFTFHKFSNVEIVGSYGLGCSINSKLRVDLQITVPSETYTKNDSINYRYHKKRAAYLAYIAAHLSKYEPIEELQYSYISMSESKPVLDFKPKGKLGNQLSVRIHLACESDAYKLHRFSPERNNLREAWLLNENTDNNTEVGPPTPYYNSSVLTDLTTSVNQEFLNEILLKSDNLKQAITLLKIWLRQRDLKVSGHVVSLLVAYFVQAKRINNIMSSYQIVRNIWIALKTSELDTKGISLHKTQEKDTCPSLEVFHKHFPVVFIDKTGYYNICWQMCKGTYAALKRESALAVDMLDNGKINSFIPLFMTPVKPLLQFDHILRFKNFNQIKKTIVGKAPKEEKVNYGVEELPLVIDAVYSLLVKGLGNRADLIQQLVEADFSWPVKKTLETARSGFEEKLSFGLVLNPENSMNVVEKGPPANLPEAEQFRAFWGDKSELRRFQDGSITETCVWEGETMAERRTVTTQIVNYLMKLKFEINPTELYHVCDQLSSVIARKQWSRGSSVLQVEETSLTVLQTFDSLRRDLRQLVELPLDISAVYGVSPVFSYTDPVGPVPRGPPVRPWQRASTCLVKDVQRDGLHTLPDYVPVCKVVIELGHSGKWPGDIHAFRCLKAAFHLQLAERLNKQYGNACQAYNTHVDVLRDGITFRLEISHPKEITLLRKEIENGVAKFRDTEESLQLQCDTVLLPRLRGALHGLHQKHPSFGATVCLFKRWLSAHLLSPPHFPAVVAELLVSAVYLQPAPAQPPATPTLGLYRAMRLLVDFDWTRDLLVLDFNEDMSREEIMEIEKKLNEVDISSRPAMRIVTSYDGAQAGAWSRAGPDSRVLARTKALARSALDYMDKKFSECADNVLNMFVPSYAGYNVLIHVHRSLVPHCWERVDSVPALRPVAETFAEDVIPAVEFNPVDRFLEELRSAYGEFALFFHDAYGGEVIAVLWKPDVYEDKEFQLTNANALKPVTAKGETKYRVNIEAIVEDFRILGAGLVRDITVNT